ncbi:6843_t:CDS:2 [Cetraspora pellucida]|uniref:6843_t:CDS:1 n=1 Tax=Cetraspora pellucida TaxID=1433469 RepID=A0A9N8W7U2_9GLOM|nr:6843_t:CDS:2 [Cetraspora pellucida]
MLNDQLTINTLRELNSRLALQIDELRKKNTEVKAENTRLKQAIEENVILKIRFKELEKKNKTNTVKLIAKNVELKDKVSKLEQKQTQVITNDQNTSSTNNILQSTACSELSDQSDREKDNNSDYLSKLEHNLTRPELLAESEISKSSLSQDTINDDSVEILEFVETIHKENISNEIRERIRKKKLQSQESMQRTSFSFNIQNNKLNPVINIHEHKITQSESIPTDQAQNTKIKIPYNKKIEQDLRDNLSIKHINKIDDQTARTLVYNEIKTLLLDITNVNLCQKTFRAKKIYILLTGIDIINCFFKKSISIDIKYQEKIGVTNCNTHVTEPFSSKDISNIEVRISTESFYTSNSEDMINKDVKSLSETEISVFAKSISNKPKTVNVFDKYNKNDDKFSDNNDNGDYCSIRIVSCEGNGVITCDGSVIISLRSSDIVDLRGNTIISLGDDSNFGLGGGTKYKKIMISKNSFL